MADPLKTSKVTVDVREDVYADLAAMAQEEHRSLKGQALWCVEQCVRQWKRAPRQPRTRREEDA